MNWDRIARSRSGWLRGVLLAAIQEAYDENCRRFAPDDLGDNNVTFGVSVSQNLRFLLERELRGASGIDIAHPRNSFVVLVDGRYHLHFYKAPPGAFDVRALRFDASATQMELVDANTEQLAFRFDGGNSATGSEPRHIVLVHFGDPIEGLHRVDVGAPVESPRDGLQWDWVECLSNPSLELSSPWVEPGVDPDEDDEFELELRDEQHNLNSDESSG